MNGRGAEWRHLRQASDDEAAIVRRFRCVRGDSALEPEEGFSRFAERAGDINIARNVGSAISIEI